MNYRSSITHKKKMNEKLCVQIWWVMNIWAVPLPFRICEHTCSQHVHEAVIDNTAVIDSITISSTSSIIYAKIIGWLGYNKRHAYSVSNDIDIKKHIKYITKRAAASFWCWFECILYISTMIHSYLLSNATLCCKGMYAKNGVLTARLYPHATKDIITKSLDLAFCGTGASSVSYAKDNLMIQQYCTIYIHASYHITKLYSTLEQTILYSKLSTSFKQISILTTIWSTSNQVILPTKPFIDIYLSTMLDHPRYIKWMSTLKPQIFKSRVARTA